MTWYDGSMVPTPNNVNDLVLAPPEEALPMDTTDDDALIRWMISLQPAERLAVAQGFVDSVVELERARTD